jgi:hypothetical protein
MGWLFLFALGGALMLIAGCSAISESIQCHSWAFPISYILINIIGGIILIGIGGIGIVKISKEASAAPRDFPASEYHLDYKITTIGEQADTTYVLTKIK